MKVQEAYDLYKIMPFLQLHQLRVAGVAAMIVDHYSTPVDKKTLIVSCLLHDMGNIVKSKLTEFPESVEPEGLNYWEDVKSVFIKKYGSSHHLATNKIAEEIGVSQKVLSLIKTSGFGSASVTLNSSVAEIKILTYADMRVSPFGVTTLEDRLSEGRKRYLDRKGPGFDTDFDRESIAVREIEKQIFMKCDISPLEISNDNVTPLLDSLRNYEIL